MERLQMNKKEFNTSINSFDLANFIKVASKNLGWGEETTDFISFLYSDSNDYRETELEENLELNEIKDYLKEDEEAAIFIPIAVSDMDGGVILANKKIIQESEVCMGSIELYEDTVVGLITSIVNDKYKFVIAEFNACTGSYEITKDYGEFGEEVSKLLERFIIKE